MAANIRKRSVAIVSLILLALVIDQVIKVVVKTNMQLGDSIPVFGDWFKILFVENNGMAFGMEIFNKIFLTGFRIVAVAFLGYVLYRLLKNDKYPFGFILCVAMVLAGALGNIIDCLFYGEIFTSSYGRIAEFVPWGEGYGTFMQGRVVDMFYFPLFTWPEQLPLIGGNIFFAPVFNFADACISCSVVALFVFYRKYLL
ncbi:MAG: lipoprotein signal peptidase [Bacteroidaceae bacterium]|jgi:signal peptidase II|nr:lipoprotein signal peptidase [Bacteroidaceae bacterium]